MSFSYYRLYNHELANSSLPTVSIDVYASKYTRLQFLTILSPLTVMSSTSPKPSPIKYNIITLLYFSNK